MSQQFTVSSHTDYWPELNQQEAQQAAERLAEMVRAYDPETEVLVAPHRPPYEETDESWYRELVQFCNDNYSECY